MRNYVEFRRFLREIAYAGGGAMVLMVCVASFGAASAWAAPYAQPGQAFRSWHEWTAVPVIRAACGDYGEPCSGHERRTLHARHWEPEPEPEPYIREERVIPVKPDCVEERYVVRTQVEPVPVRRVEETADEWCGIKCWYRRLRAGYCGRGCDYYRFRMTEFPSGRLGVDRVRVACR
jgi:hypothetical protein